MAASPRRTGPQSSPAGNDEPAGLDELDGLEGYDPHHSDDDVCGHGCHSNGVAPGALTVGCEHGTYKVRENTRRKAPAANTRPQTVHDRDLHHPGAEPEPAPGFEGVKVVAALANAHENRILQLEAEVRQIKVLVAQLLEQAPAGE